MTGKLTYFQAIERWNDFLNDTGISTLCTTLCKGKCCYSCHLRNENGCTEETPHLACKAHLCSPLRHLLWDEDFARILKNLELVMINSIKPILGGVEAQYHSHIPQRCVEALDTESLIPARALEVLCDVKRNSQGYRQVGRILGLFRGIKESEDFIRRLQLADSKSKPT
tara:strand:+ start:1349 stop:1855 length:507 start_codon:yes stop_codon:yes gene_type:complete